MNATTGRRSGPRTPAVGAAAVLLVAHAVLWVGGGDAGQVVVTPDSARLRLDPNSATAAELELLPRIGPQLAANIVQYRVAASAQPAFRRAADLDAVPRIGPATIARLEPYLCFHPDTAASRPAP